MSAACFGGAIDFVAKQHKQDAANAQVTCAVSIGPRDGGGFGLAVKMRVEDKSLKQAELTNLVRRRTKRSAPTLTPRVTLCRRQVRRDRRLALDDLDHAHGQRDQPFFTSPTSNPICRNQAASTVGPPCCMQDRLGTLQFHLLDGRFFLLGTVFPFVCRKQIICRR